MIFLTQLFYLVLANRAVKMLSKKWERELNELSFLKSLSKQQPVESWHTLYMSFQAESQEAFVAALKSEGQCVGKEDFDIRISL